MRPHVIKVPDIGEGIAEVELSAWHVKPGDRVSEDQPLADVMTDKAAVEIPSPFAGTVLSLGGEEGQTIAVGAELIRIEVEGEAKAPAPARAEATAQPAPPPPPSAEATPAKPPAPAPAASSPPPAAPPPPARASQRRAPGERPIASPSVRRRAWELDIDLADVEPSGPGGRIMHVDLDKHAAEKPKPASPPHAESKPAAAPAPAAARREAGQAREGEQKISVTGVRRKIAEKMQESKRRIPHFTYVEEVDVTELEALRTQLNTRWGTERGRLTVLPFLMRAIVLAVAEFPQVNARFDDDAGVVTRYAAVHLGIATQTASGLMVPVVRHAETLDLWASAAEVSKLAQAARSGRATREQLTGSTLTITSLGALGGIVSTPVINHPEVAIVGVNRIVERPVIRQGAVVPRLLMNLSSSFDHRVIDGQDAAEFVQGLRRRLEAPAMLFID